MCPICYYHEIAGLIQPKLSMFSTCNHWFQAPSPPVFPVKDPHLKQRQEGRIVDLGPIHLLKPLCPSNHMGPESIVKKEVWICVSPPLIVGSLCVLSCLRDPVEGILGNLSISLSVSIKRKPREKLPQMLKGNDTGGEGAWKPTKTS